MGVAPAGPKGISIDPTLAFRTVPMTAPAPTSPPTRSVQLPEELVAAIEERVRGTAFDSVDAFIAFVLARLLDHPGTTGFTEEEERTLRERLRSLGYID